MEGETGGTSPGGVFDADAFEVGDGSRIARSHQHVRLARVPPALDLRQRLLSHTANQRPIGGSLSACAFACTWFAVE